MADNSYEIGGIFSALLKNSLDECSGELQPLTSLFSTSVEPNSAEKSRCVLVKKTTEVKKKKRKRGEGEELTKVEEDGDEDEEDDDLMRDVFQDRIPRLPDDEEITAKKRKLKPRLEDAERTERTLFVGNVSTELTRKDVRKLFASYGPIESVRLRSVTASDPKVSKKVATIKREFHPERSAMNAYVVFKEKDSREKALAHNNTLVNGCHIRTDTVAIRGSTEKRDQKLSLFVGNLSFAGANEETVRAHFAPCGDITDVRIVRDAATGLGRGFGYVSFASASAVLLGLKLNKSTLDERSIRVYRCTSKGNQGSNSNRGSSGGNQGNSGGNQGNSGGKQGNSAGPIERNRETKKNDFSGLRSTSKKDQQKGKAVFGMGKQHVNPALRRMKNNQKKASDKKKKSFTEKQRKNLNKNSKAKFSS